MSTTPAAGTHTLYLAAGCFWGVERLFWSLPGVTATQVGYMGGSTPHPSYEQVCTGATGHTETVRVDYDPSATDLPALLATFWENHDPTTPDRQGNDIGTQYRSAIFFTSPEQEEEVRASAARFQQALGEAHRGLISTQIEAAESVGEFFPAEEYHQRYLEKNPGGYCNHGFKGVTCPIPS